MRTYLDCIPCFFKQALDAARLAGADPKTQKKVVDSLAKIIPAISLNLSPPEIGKGIYGLVSMITRKDDPFKKIKQKSNRLALGLYKTLKEKVSRSHNKLLTAVELAIAGNIIDYGAKNSLNIERELQRILREEREIAKKKGKANFDYPEFRRILHRSKTILYLADNAGEVVFDRILIEEIKKLYEGKEIIYAVKERPIINDALKEDARVCGIDKKTEVISSGLDIPGTVLSMCSKSFLKVYEKAQIVISKGQGNFEALAQEKSKPVFFLFMAKCPVVASHIGGNIGDIVLLYNKKKRRK